MENPDSARSAPISSTPRPSTKRLKPAFTTRIAKGTANVSSTSIHGSVKGAGNMRGDYTPPRTAVKVVEPISVSILIYREPDRGTGDRGLARAGDVHYASVADLRQG